MSSDSKNYVDFLCDEISKLGHTILITVFSTLKKFLAQPGQLEIFTEFPQKASFKPIESIFDPPWENRDKGDSTLTTRFHFKTKEFGFSTLKACSGAHFISKLFWLVGHTRNKKACSH